MSILLLHGFTGHPDDLAPIEHALSDHGLLCRRPALPGHATTLEDLNQTSMQDWLDFVLAQEAPDAIIGLSMGALLGILLTNRRPVSKLILISPAFYLKPWGRLGVWLATHGLSAFLKTYPKTAGSDIADPAGKAICRAYPQVPLKALIEFDRIRQQALLELPKVSCPMFSFFGAKDRTIDVEKSASLLQNPVIFPNSAHILPLDYAQKELIKQCLKILEK